ncbi:MAG: epoxyqueuosine reductase QueH [Bacilli bacterium]|nr:epoxyqueuosine reductase QueH [Bacilli bacterium]
MKENYHKKMLEILNQIKESDSIPTLLLHTCCAPCSTTVIQRLSDYFQITVIYYNPNIEPEDEYLKRKSEQIRFLREYPAKNKITFFENDWDNEAFKKISLGYENELEGGVRCHRCYYLRLEKTAQIAQQKHFDYFTTSLTISPYKNSQIINQIGKVLEDKYGVAYLYSDFKKENGYLESIQNSKEYGLYRQDYCGCLFSKNEDHTK